MIKAVNYGTEGWDSDGNLEFPELVSISYNVFGFDPNAKYKVLCLLEPKHVVAPTRNSYPHFYRLLNDDTEMIDYASNSFDLVLTYEPNILKYVSNSEKFIMGDCWLDFDKLSYDRKQNKISYLTSNKYLTIGHLVRKNIFESLSKYAGTTLPNGFDYLQHVSPPRIPSKNLVFEEFKFSIIVENDQCVDYFTEKLIDCLASKTIPIYWGCPNVGDYFNMDGIITFRDHDELEKIILSLYDGLYEEKLSAIEENYELSKKYINNFKRIEKIINDNFFGGGN